MIELFIPLMKELPQDDMILGWLLDELFEVYKKVSVRQAIRIRYAAIWLLEGSVQVGMCSFEGFCDGQKPFFNLFVQECLCSCCGLWVMTD